MARGADAPPDAVIVMGRWHEGAPGMGCGSREAGLAPTGKGHKDHGPSIHDPTSTSPRWPVSTGLSLHLRVLLQRETVEHRLKKTRDTGGESEADGRKTTPGAASNVRW